MVVGSTEALLVVPSNARGQLAMAPPECATLFAVEAPGDLASLHGVCVFRQDTSESGSGYLEVLVLA